MTGANQASSAGMIDTAALRALAVLATTKTVAATADELGFTPSAVSQQIKRLESQVGVPLIARAGRGVVLTPAGEALVAAADDVFEALETAAEIARSHLGEPTGQLRIAAFSTAIRGLLAPRLEGLRSAYPALRITIDEQDPARAIQAVATGAADLALLHDADGIPTPVPGGLSVRHVHTDLGDIVVHRAHRLAARADAAAGAPVSSADLDGEVWVTSPPGTVCHQWFERLLADRAQVPDVRHRIDDFSTQLALVATGEVIALIPRLARPPMPAQLVAIPIEPPPVRRIDAAWRRSADASPAIRAVLAALTADHTG